MPYSMTGFAACESLASPFRLVWELRSVNHRFLDISFRLPEELRALEPGCRDAVSGSIRRGKLDCILRVTHTEAQSEVLAVDEKVLEQLLEIAREIRSRFPNARPLGIADILRWPGAIVEPKREPAVLEAPVLRLLGETLEALQTARSREGERIAAFLDARCESILNLIAQVRPRLASAQERQRAKLEERLARLRTEVDAERLEQELAVLLQRLDVEEEVDRLSGHVSEVRHVLGKSEPVGRRLDFLVQELNREANTFASKVQDEELTRAAVELKVLVEQMREQVQNLE